MTHISTRFGQFRYFDAQLRHPEWKGKSVLDFGGNVGNMLRAADCTIDEERYWCIDVSRDAIARGRRDRPKALWMFYDRYNDCFNPDGRRGLPLPPIARRFDYILAYSVFTHIVPSEMRALLADLMTLLNDDGVLAFSFIDPFFHSWPGEYAGDNFRWRLDRINAAGLKVDATLAARAVRGAPWFVLTDDASVWVETERLPKLPWNRGRSFHVFHASDFIARLYPHAEILPPAERDMQHCCIMRKNGRGGWRLSDTVADRRPVVNTRARTAGGDAAAPRSAASRSGESFHRHEASSGYRP